MTTKFTNGASDDIIGPASTLASGVAVGAVSMTVAAGTGDRFPVIAAPDIAYVTLQNATKVEVVKITARAAGADTMTIVKAQEGTTDRAWLTGDVVSMRITAAQAESAVNAQAVAAAALTAHEAHADPHPGYVTTAELTAALVGEQDADSELGTLAAMASARAAELAALSAFMGSLMNDADQAAALATLGALLNGFTEKTAGYTVVAADRGKLIDYTSGTATLAFDAAATLGVFACAVRNSGSGTITLDPNGAELIDGAATTTLGPGESCFVLCNGTALKTIAKTATATDEKAKVSSNDTTPGYLNGKLVAGTGVSLTEGSDGGNETLTIGVSGYVSTDVCPTASIGAVAVGGFAYVQSGQVNTAPGTSYAYSVINAALAAGTWRSLSAHILNSGGGSGEVGLFQRIA